MGPRRALMTPRWPSARCLAGRRLRDARHGGGCRCRGAQWQGQREVVQCLGWYTGG